MRCLTLTQPFATLVAIGVKPVETRGWFTRYRGPLAIHAAAGLAPIGGKRGYQQLCSQEPFRRVLTAYYNRYKRTTRSVLELANWMPLGAILATCMLADCLPTAQVRDGLDADVRAFGDFSDGRFALILTDIKQLPTPIPAKGMYGLWEWTPPPGLALGKRTAG